MNRTLLIVAVLAVIGVGLGFWQSGRRAQSGAVGEVIANAADSRGYVDIAGSQLEERLASAQPPIVVDVRELHEYTAGHIPGALLIPLGTVRARAGELAKDADIVLVCRSGNRSGQAAAILAPMGFAKLFNLRGGMSAWKGAVELGPPKAY